MQKKEKRYYWLKLTENFFFEENGAFDFLMNFSASGARYVVIYQMLCLKTINTCGVFVTKYGDLIVKLTIPKIKKDLKHFSEDEIMIAIELFKQVGLVIEDKNGFLEIKGHESLIGSETDAAQRQRKHRLKEAATLSLPSNDDTAEESDKKCDIVTPDVTTKIIRYKDILDIHSSNTDSLNNTVSCSVINEIADDVVTSGVTNNDNDNSNFYLEAFKPGAEWEGLMMSSEQFEDLCGRLSFDEINYYFGKMVSMIKKGYQFRTSHYAFILKMVNEDRRINQ